MALTLGQFTEQLTSSGLMTGDEVSAALAELLPGVDPASANAPQQVETLARGLVKQKKLTPFQAQQLYAGRGKTLLLGNYVVLDKLGQGGMGMVLKAQHRRMKRLVALKILAPAIAKSADLQARFQREVEAAARLSHPNIVAAYDADVAGETYFLVMEYVEGRDLSSRVKSDGPLAVSETLTCILQAARGLGYAHQQGIIHRDIKPANLLLDVQGNVKILDMGLARITGDTGARAELTSTGDVMGTVDYMAPEQARSTKNADARSDIYSLGISLWYLLTGQPAFPGDSLTERLLAHQSQPIPSLSGARPGISTSLDQLFRKMVAKQPHDRYQTMEEVCTALEGELQQAGGSADRTTPSPNLAVQAGAIAGNPSNVTEVRTATRPVVTTAATTKLAATAAQAANTATAGATDQTFIFEELAALPSRSEKTSRAKASRAKARSGSRRSPALIAAGVGVPILGIIAFGVLWGTSSKGKPTTGETGQQVSATPQPVSAAASLPASRNLLADIVAPRDSQEGVWRMSTQGLISPVMPFAQIGLPEKLPTDFRLTLEVTRQSGVGPLVIGLPFGTSRCVSTIDTQSGSHFARLEVRSGSPQNAGSRVLSASDGLPVGQKTRIVCDVRGNSYELSLNGASLLRFTGAPSELTTPAYWSLLDPQRGFLGACLSEFHVSQLSLESLGPRQAR